MSLINAIPFDGVPISSDSWRQFQRGLLAPLRSFLVDDGLVYSPATSGFKVTVGAGSSVDVSAGAGWAAGVSFWSESSANLPVSAPHATYNRWDYVVARIDFVSKTAQLVVKEGTPAASPAVPSLDKSASPFYEISLAVLLIAAGSGISQVHDRREFVGGSPTIMRRVRNVSGQEMYPGQIVVWNQFSPTDVTFSTTPGDKWVAGTIASLIPNGSYGLLVEHGYGLVKLGLTTGAGTRLGISSVAGNANEVAFNYAVTVLESGNSGSVVPCYVDVRQVREPVITLTKDIQQSTTLTTAAYIEGLSTSFFLRFGGHVQITMRAIAQYVGAGGGWVQFRPAIDGTDVGAFVSSNIGTQFQDGFFSFTHIFPNIAAGNHTAGVKWLVNAAGNQGILRGDWITSTVQIAVL